MGRRWWPTQGRRSRADYGTAQAGTQGQGSSRRLRYGEGGLYKGTATAGYKGTAEVGRKGTAAAGPLGKIIIIRNVPRLSSQVRVDGDIGVTLDAAGEALRAGDARTA